MLVGDIPGRQDTALKLLHLLLQQFHSQNTTSPPNSMFDRVIRLCFQLLDTTDEDQVRSRNLARLIHFLFHHRFWDTRNSFTAAQFDLSMDYHLRICEGTDYNLIKGTFWMLELGSSNDPERMRRYIDTIIRFVGEETTCVSTLRAASAIRVEIASVTQDDESLREGFSQVLASAVLLDPKQTMPADKPFKEISSFYWARDRPYLQLLCTLAQYSTWHLQLHQNGHFDNCLAIAKMLSSQKDGLFHAGKYAASVAHIFAIIDASGDETHPVFYTVRAYPRRLLVLHTRDYIFKSSFFRWPTEDNWITLSREGYINSLPSLIAYARKQFNDNEESLLVLVEQACRKLDEEKQQLEQGDAQHAHDRSFWYEAISALLEGIKYARR